MELSNKQNTAQPLPPLMMTTTTMTVSDDGNVSGDNILSEVEEEEVPPLPFPSPRQTIFKNFRFHNMDGKCQSNSLPNFAHSEKRQRKTREKKRTHENNDNLSQYFANTSTQQSSTSVLAKTGNVCLQRCQSISH